MADFVPCGQPQGFVHLPPPDGSTIVLSLGTPGSGSATLSWTDSNPQNLEWGVFIGTSAGEEDYTNPQQTTAIKSAIVSGLTIGETYYFTVRALNSSGFGSSSNEVSVAGSADFPVYYGFIPNTNPDAAAILALTGSNNGGYAGTYDLTQPDGTAQYPCLAFLASYGIPHAFTSGLVYGMLMLQITISGVAYNVFISPTATYANAITFVVS